MFEKEAEEILNNHCDCELLPECMAGVRCRCSEFEESKELLIEGIEFGYNKAKEELELKIKHLTEHLEPQAMTSLFEQVEEEVRQERRIEDLEKENAELKNRDCWKTCEYANPKSELIVQHIKDVQNLTKAKDIIEELIRFQPYIDREAMFHSIGNEWKIAIYKARQFLKEVSE